MKNSQMEQYKIQEAKKRMGTYAGNAGMTNAVSSNAAMSNAASNAAMSNAASNAAMSNAASNAAMSNSVVSSNANLKGSEKLKAKEDMSSSSSMY